MNQTFKLVFAYSIKDEKYRQQLEDHLSFLDQKKINVKWYQYHETEKNNLCDLTQTDIVGVLVSPSFSKLTFTNRSCKDFINKAIKLCNQQKIYLIPILLIPCHNWQDIFQGIELQPLPKNRKFIKSWQNKDEAYVNIAQGIEEAVQEVLETRHKPDFPPIYVEKTSKPLQIEEKKILNLDKLSNLFRQISSLITRLLGNISLPQRVIKRKGRNKKILKKALKHRNLILAIILVIIVLTWPKLQAMSQCVSSVINYHFLPAQKVQLINQYFSYVSNQEQRKLAWEMLDPKGTIRQNMSFKTYDQWWNQRITQKKPKILKIEKESSQILVTWEYCHITERKLGKRTEQWKFKENNHINKWLIDPNRLEDKDFNKKC